MKTIEELLEEVTPDYDYDAISNELHEILDNVIEKRVAYEMSIGSNSASIFIYSARGLFIDSIRNNIINDIVIGANKYSLENKAIITDARNSFLNELKYKYGYKKSELKTVATSDVFLELEW